MTTARLSRMMARRARVSPDARALTAMLVDLGMTFAEAGRRAGLAPRVLESLTRTQAAFSPGLLAALGRALRAPLTEEESAEYERTALALGRRLRELRQARGWSQAEAAHRLGTEPSWLSGCELGSFAPAAGQVAWLEQLYGVDLQAESIAARRVLQRAYGRVLAMEIRVPPASQAEEAEYG